MASRIEEPMRPLVVNTAKLSAAHAPQGFRRHASLALTGTGLIFLLGTLLDFVILWTFQRQTVPQWEFTALASLAEGLPRLVLAIALLYAALYTRESTSLLLYRLLALGLIMIGLIGAIAGALMLTDYFVLRRQVNAEVTDLFRSMTFKTLALCAMYVFILLPIGVLGLRRPSTG
jgi:hypothetical protein